MYHGGRRSRRERAPIVTARWKMNPDEIPELPGYVTVAALAKKYNVNKGTIYYLLYNKRAFASACKVSKGEGDERPLILLATREADRVMSQRSADKGDRAQD